MRRALTFLYAAWMGFAHILGRIQTAIILGLIYFVVMGVIAPLSRLFTGDPLDRRLGDRSSVWTAKERTNQTLEEGRHLF